MAGEENGHPSRAVSNVLRALWRVLPPWPTRRQTFDLTLVAFVVVVAERLISVSRLDGAALMLMFFGVVVVVLVISERSRVG